MTCRIKRRAALFAVILVVVFPRSLFADDFTNQSVSFSPITFVGLFFVLPVFEEVNLRNIWITFEGNWITANQAERGAGITIRNDRVALSARHRFFYNRQTQSGFFWGLYGLVEWRRTHWYYDEDGELQIDPFFPNERPGSIFHSVGLTGGLETGFRVRSGNTGITPFLRLGIPVFFPFGDLPPNNEFWEFYAMNALVRGITLGLRIDIFYPGR
ncbi:MAG: hypothetical protein FWC64_08800 [Treponema sp.]|nr:hypothetical protein [Treponema sp.]